MNNRVDKESDLWETPQYLYDELNKEFNFKFDLCANETNKKADITPDNYLKYDMLWVDCSCFMNPPYSNPRLFIEKAYQDSKYCTIVMLIKCDTSTRSWGVFWDYDNNKPKPGVEVRFLPKRLKFERNGVPSKNSANFPSVIVVMNRKYLN
jgi:site-specific DNA-methyltransferase (adenine-specific)